MFFSYGASVLLLSFALFGICCFLKELWSWVVQPYLFKVPEVSFLVMVKDAEQEIEEMIRHMMMEVELAGIDCDIVIVDCGSNDLTYSILERLSKEFYVITAVRSSGGPEVMRDALTYCEGGVIHVLDTINRIAPEHFIAVVCWLLKETVPRIKTQHS